MGCGERNEVYEEDSSQTRTARENLGLISCKCGSVRSISLTLDLGILLIERLLLVAYQLMAETNN
jgi:hypothetical protein